MNDLIRESIEAFEAARVEFHEDSPGHFFNYLYDYRGVRTCAARKYLVKHFVPVLEKRIKPDRIEGIDGLLEKMQNEYPDVHVRLSGKGKGSIWNGAESFLLPFGPDYQYETPEDALRSLLKPVSGVIPADSFIVHFGDKTFVYVRKD